ncbi:MAG: hypothetical protein ABIP71_06820 [Verrucomicrobiota bacterium]
MKATLFSLLLASVAAAADFPIDLAESRFQGSNYVSEVWSSSLTNSPSWDAEKSAPPLSPKRAGTLAVQSAYVQLGTHPAWPAQFGEPAWDVDQVALVQGYGDGAPWYYRVRVHPRIAGSHGSSGVTLFVTLDGRVLPLRGVPPRQRASRVR